MMSKIYADNLDRSHFDSSGGIAGRGVAMQATGRDLSKISCYYCNKFGHYDPFSGWGGGGGDVTNLSPFWEETARKQLLPGTYLTNPLVKCDEFGASLPTM